jgi:uncharacterized protein YebE (UPF0316 family)
MDISSALADYLGLDVVLIHFFVLPLLIFLARVLDVSINTLRIIFMLHGNKIISPLLGFFESLIWLLAISQIFQNLNSWPTYVSYSMGFGTGILVGMLIEERLALGYVVIRVITQKPADELVKFLSQQKVRYANIVGMSATGDVNVLFCVIRRSRLDEIIDNIKIHNPAAFYTVEGVKKVIDLDVTDERGFSFKKFRWKPVKT